MIKFITGNANKFKEISAVVPGLLEQLDVDLPEIQEFDAHLIIRDKLEAARLHHDDEFIIEDTSLYLDCLNGLPGPLIKWFVDIQGIPAIAEMCQKMGNTGATAKTIIGYKDKQGEVHFFENSLRGTIVSPRGDKDFGWGPIFVPEGQGLTFGEMELEVKHEISMRSKAARLLGEFLDKQKRST